MPQFFYIKVGYEGAWTCYTDDPHWHRRVLDQDTLRCLWYRFIPMNGLPHPNMPVTLLTRKLYHRQNIKTKYSMSFITGKVIDGHLILRKIENVPTGPNNKPKVPVVISQCGEM